MKRKKQISLVILLSLFFLVQISAQNTWYVNDVTGNDNYTGITATFISGDVGPKKTISSAISSSANQDTIYIVSTGITYGTDTSEPDTIVISKELIFKGISGVIDINSNLEINVTDSDTLGNGVEILSQFHLQNNLSIYCNIILKDTMTLDGNLRIGSVGDSSEIGMLTYFYSPLIFSGNTEQTITVPEEGAGFGSFEINKPFGNIILEGGDLDLSVEVSDTTIKNVVTFTKGLFITGDNKLILKAPAGTDQLGFIHNPALGDVSHVVGVVGVNPKLAAHKKFAKTIWPIGSEEYYRSFSMIIFNTIDINLGINIYSEYIDEKASETQGLPVTFNEKLITYYPKFYWNLSTEGGNDLSNLIYDLEFTIEGFSDYEDLNEIVIIKKWKSLFSPEYIWFLQGMDYENEIEAEIPVIKCVNTVGAFNRNNISTITLGFPTNLYTTGVMPDIQMTTNWSDTATIDFYNLFRGNKGKLSYSVSVDRDSIVSVPENGFMETSFNIIALDTGSVEVTITASDTNGDFLTSSFGVKVGIIADGIEELENSPVLPKEYSLNQNYPNPFNPTTNIRFGLPEASVVKLGIYNILGEEIATLVNNVELAAGYHTYNFDGNNLTSGLYIYRIEAGKFVEVKKMMLIK
jgi:hypothetical protein